MTMISELPLEVLIDSILPYLALRDLLSLACTSKLFAIICADDTFWKRKTQDEYNFSGAGSARTSGFRHVYRGLRSPRVFVWGDSGNDRLALSKRKHPIAEYNRSIDYPVELDIQRRVVHLAAGGWSFHALTDDGRVLVWGVLDAQAHGMAMDNLAYSGASIEVPVALILPQRIKALGVGRRHAILLDAHNDVWVLRSWGRPARLVAPGPKSDVVQVEAGWDVCALLTLAGDVFVVFPFHGSFDAEAQSRLPQPGGQQTEVVPTAGEVPCECWDIQHHPTRLPPLPTNLPTLHPSSVKEAPPRIVKIAAGEHFVVALTDRGHVLKLDLPTSNETELGQIIARGNLQWDYLPRFCDVARVRTEPGFRQQPKGPALEDLTVTHISAQFRTFVVYSTTGSSVVLLGKGQTTSEDAPTVVPELQNRNVISVVLGDYHYCALTSDGELFSWGKYSNGALGLGGPAPSNHSQFTRIAAPMLHQPRRPPQQDADVPTRVTFDHEDGVRDRYVFGVAAAGWHCGALVIDLHSSPSASTEPKSNQANDHTPTDGPSAPIAHLPRRTEGPQITLPIVRGRGSLFRIGYAARGAYSGSGRGNIGGSNSGSDGGNQGRAEE